MPKRRVAPGRAKIAKWSPSAMPGLGAHVGRRSTPGPTSTVSGASSERAPRSSVAQKLIASSPLLVAVR